MRWFRSTEEESTILGSSRAKRVWGDKLLDIWAFNGSDCKAGATDTAEHDGVNGEISNGIPSLDSRRWQLYDGSDKSRDPSFVRMGGGEGRPLRRWIHLTTCLWWSFLPFLQRPIPLNRSSQCRWKVPITLSRFPVADYSSNRRSLHISILPAQFFFPLNHHTKIYHTIKRHRGNFYKMTFHRDNRDDHIDRMDVTGWQIS